MKKIVFLLFSLITIISCKKEVQETEVLTEKPIKEVKNPHEITVVDGGFKFEALTQMMMSVEGTTHSFGSILNRYKGKIILIDVWASWCPDCIEGLPKLKKLQNDFDNVVYIFLSYDKTEQDWRIGYNKYDLKGENFLILDDWKTGKFRETIDLDWIPRYIVVDQTGKIVLYKAIEADDPVLFSTLKEISK